MSTYFLNVPYMLHCFFFQNRCAAGYFNDIRFYDVCFQQSLVHVLLCMFCKRLIPNIASVQRGLFQKFAVCKNPSFEYILCAVIIRLKKDFNLQIYILMYLTTTFHSNLPLKKILLEGRCFDSFQMLESRLLVLNWQQLGKFFEKGIIKLS